MRRVIVSLVILLTVGCVESRYTQEGKRAMEAEQDVLRCEDKILKEHQGLVNTTADERQKLRDDCMKEKGYAVQE